MRFLLVVGLQLLLCVFLLGLCATQTAAASGKRGTADRATEERDARRGSVTERIREIGVRAALGASRGDILALVVRQGMTVTALGVAIGLIGGAAASEAIAAMLFGVSRLDPLTYGGVVALLGGVAAVGCGLPAWRAAQVDPASTLRAE